MPTVPLDARVEEAVTRVVEAYCRPHGISLSHFVQVALLNRLEELEDAADIA